jgi:hypothetical protein
MFVVGWVSVMRNACGSRVRLTRLRELDSTEEAVSHEHAPRVSVSVNTIDTYNILAR